MTQKYYINRLLPIYVKAIKSMREIDDNRSFYKKMATLLTIYVKKALRKSIKRLIIFTTSSTLRKALI